jgi:hypothetical protein
MSNLRVARVIVAAFACIVVGAVQSAEHSDDSNRPAPTKEQREQMAKVHEMMAACLRSDKSVMECREAAHKQCEEAMGPQCHMMGPMMGPEHHMNKQRENGASDPKPKQ